MLDGILHDQAPSPLLKGKPIDTPALTGGVLNDYVRGSSRFTGPCSHPRLHRRGTPAGLGSAR